jgi:hypothetical protein
LFFPEALIITFSGVPKHFGTPLLGFLWQVLMQPQNCKIAQQIFSPENEISTAGTLFLLSLPKHCNLIDKT